MKILKLKEAKSGLWSQFFSWRLILKENVILFSICLVLSCIVFYEKIEHDNINYRTSSNQISMKSGNEEASDNIPHLLWFTSQYNILKTRDPIGLYDNVVNTITSYRKTWGEDDVPVHFTNDEDCLVFITEMEPRIVKYFLEEQQGPFKADICRVAALYIHGGYYFDIDMTTVEPFVLSGGKYTFATVRCKKNTEGYKIASTCGFFQSFFASTPGNHLLRDSMDRMLQVYIDGSNKNMLGVVAMYEAYENLSEEDKQLVYLLNTFELDNVDVGNKLRPDLERNNGSGNCNWIVEDNESTVNFFARSPMPFNSGCIMASGIHNNLFFTGDTKQEVISEISQFFYDKSFGSKGSDKVEDEIYRRKMYIFDSIRLFTLDHSRCYDEVEEAKPELGKFYREFYNIILHPSSDMFFDICVVAALYNQGGFFHSKDLILNGEGYLPIYDSTMFVATFSPRKKTFTRGYLAASPHHAILKESLNMIVDATKSVGDTFSIMDIVYKAYMDVGGHTELLYDICSTFGMYHFPLYRQNKFQMAKM